MRSISRRGFISASGAALGALPLVRSIDALAQVTNPVFRHGVASGDPLTDRVILWTRVTPPAGAVAQSVSWELARDEKRVGAPIPAHLRRAPPWTTSSTRSPIIRSGPHFATSHPA